MTRFSVEEEEQQEEVCSKKRKQRGSGLITIKRKRRRLPNILEEATEEEEEKQHDREEEEQEMVGGGEEEDDEVEVGEVGESSGSVHENSSDITVRIDPDVLDCAICCEPLRPPLLQCQFGHVACSSCCAKLSNKCHVCSNAIGYSRCLALEKVLESMRIRCSHARYGCERSFSYSQRHAHEETCIYAPCHCPIDNCTFRGATRMLVSHISRVHHQFAQSFRYDQPLRVEFWQTDPFVLLREDDNEDDHLFLLINNDDKPLGRTLSIACIRPSTLGSDFTYELTTSKGGRFIQLRAPTTNIKDLIGYHPPKTFLLLPVDFISSTGIISLDVCIRKVKSSAVT